MSFLDNWQEIIMSQGRERQRQISQYWKKVNNSVLYCGNAFYILKERKIKCALTRKECVCSYESGIVNGHVLSDICVDCPGFERRQKVRKKIEKEKKDRKKV